MKKNIFIIAVAIFFLGTVQGFSNDYQILRDLRSNNYKIANDAIMKVQYNRVRQAHNIRKAHAVLKSLITNQAKSSSIRIAAAHAVAYLNMQSAKYDLRTAISREKNPQVRNSFQRALKRLGGDSYSGSKYDDNKTVRDLRSRYASVALPAIRNVKYGRMNNSALTARAKNYLLTIIKNRRLDIQIRREAAYAVAHLNYKEAIATLKYARSHERNISLKRSFDYALNKLQTGTYSGKTIINKGTGTYQGTGKHGGTPSNSGTLRYTGTKSHSGTPSHGGTPR